MTTETTDPLQQAVMEAAERYRNTSVAYEGCVDHESAMERLRLHVQLALAKARWEAFAAVVSELCIPSCERSHDKKGTLCWPQQQRAAAKTEIAALEARLQED